MKRLRAILCFFGIHRYETHQEVFETSNLCRPQNQVVIAWRCCNHCCQTKLVHILK